MIGKGSPEANHKTFAGIGVLSIPRDILPAVFLEGFKARDPVLITPKALEKARIAHIPLDLES
jgi:hypothetical protein